MRRCYKFELSLALSGNGAFWRPPSGDREVLTVGKKCIGVSLLEVLLALGIFSVALLGIMGVYAIGMKQSVVAEQSFRATEMGSEILERVGELGFDDLPDTNVEFDSRRGDLAVDGFPPAPYPTRNNLQAQVYVDQMGPTLKSVCVRVHYQSGKSVGFQTYFRR